MGCSCITTRLRASCRRLAATDSESDKQISCGTRELTRVIRSSSLKETARRMRSLQENGYINPHAFFEHWRKYTSSDSFPLANASTSNFQKKGKKAKFWQKNYKIYIYRANRKVEIRLGLFGHDSDATLSAKRLGLQNDQPRRGWSFWRPSRFQSDVNHSSTRQPSPNPAKLWHRPALSFSLGTSFYCLEHNLGF